jgi:hypothetical protein
MSNTRRSFPAKRKLEVIEFAEIKGNWEVGKEFDVNEKQVRE